MKRAFIVRGAKWGDEGKGHIVEALAHLFDADLVIRDVGGAQAAHNVVLQNGTHHTFKQFGSATFQGVPTLLSYHFAVDPFELEREAKELQQKGIAYPWDLMYIHEDALIVTPMHKMGDDTWRKKNPGISTCGMGIGEMRWLAKRPNWIPNLALRVLDALSYEHTHYRLGIIQRYYNQHDLHLNYNLEAMADRIQEIVQKCHIVSENTWQLLRNFSNTLIFEGAQGALLDAERGDKPYVTSSCTGYENALEMLEGYKGDITRIAVMRSYETIHDGNNPHFRENPEMTRALPEKHNKDNPFQGAWRCGEFDMEITRRSLEILKDTDYIAMTHLDRVPYWNTDDVLGIPIGVHSYGSALQDVNISITMGQ